MEFCNLIGTDSTDTFARKVGRDSGIPLRIATEEALDAYGIASNVWVQSTGTEVVIRHADEGGNGAIVENNLFAMVGNRDEDVIPFYKRKGEAPILWADVQESEENPAIIVMCKALYLINGIKTYIKFLNVDKDRIVAMLVCGAIGFLDSEQQIITMTRNLPEGVSVTGRKMQLMTPANLNDMLSLTDSNGYRYNMDMAISAYVFYGQDMTNVRVLKDACVVFDPQAEVRAKAVADAKAERLRKEEERKAAEAAEREAARIQQEENAAREREVKRIQEEARREASKNRAREKAAATRAAKSEIKTPEGSSRNAGAEFFLAMLGKAEG